MILSQVTFITAEDTIDLRSRILRPNQALENCKYLEDNDANTFHLGIFIEGRLVSNGTFIQQPHSHFENMNRAYRLRGMASDTQYQRQGLGRLIIEAALAELKKRNSDLLWFNARTSAEAFYKKLNFETIEEIFDIPLIGPHKVMYKLLK